MSVLARYSSVGKIRLGVYVWLLLVNTVVLALAGAVNNFQDFFFVADIFPFALSLLTLVVLLALVLTDFHFENALIARPPFEIIYLSILTILWLAFNVFSTSRWQSVPIACSSIPDSFADERSWCMNVQALKAFVWIDWVTLFMGLAFTIRYAVTQNSLGNKHVWSTALSRYTPREARNAHARTSSFWDKGRASAFTQLR